MLRIQIDVTTRLVDPIIPSLDYNLFAEEFGLHKHQQEAPEIRKKTSSKEEEASPSSNHKQNVQFEECKGKINSETHNKSSYVSQDDNEQCSAVKANIGFYKKETSQSLEADAGSKEVSDPEILPSFKIRTQTGIDTEQNIVKSATSDDSGEVEYVAEGESKIGSKDLSSPSKTAHVSRPTKLSGLEKDGCNFISDVHLHQKILETMDSKSIAQSSSYKSLADMDNKSGVLHVWFLLLDGLVSSVNRCPKAVQSHTLNTLINLLKSAANVPGEPSIESHEQPDTCLLSTNEIII